MDAPDKVHYEDDTLLVTALRVLVKEHARTLLIADICDPRLVLEAPVRVDPSDSLWTQLRHRATGAVAYMECEVLSVRHQGRVEELDRTLWFSGSPQFEKEYAESWSGSEPVRNARARLRAIAEAIGAVVADHAARHPEARAAAPRGDESGRGEAQAVRPAAPVPEPPKQGGGAVAGFGGLALIALIIGGLFLYQREGGKVFDEKKSQPIVPAVVFIKASLDPGFRSHDVVLNHTHNDGTNPNGGRLTDVEVTLVLYREDGTRHEVKRVWAAWDKGETKKVNVPAHKYQKGELIGTCTASDPFGNVGKHNVEYSWTWNWERK